MWRIAVCGIAVGSLLTALCCHSKACNRAEYHIVQKGDTLWKISRMHNVSLSELCKTNRLSEKSILHPGDKIRIMQAPQASNAKATLADSTTKLQPGMMGVIKATNVNVRSKPSISSRRIGMVNKGDFGVVVATQGRWVKLSFKRDLKALIGWVRMDFVGVGDAKRLARHNQINFTQKAANRADSSPLPSRGSMLADMAQCFVGISYRRGASYPSRGFDCSGFVYYLLLRFGVTVPRTASAMFKVGKPVERAKLRPGDLVFFRTTSSKRITHVGVYIGNGKFIHASSGAGRVIISPLTYGYYANRYAGARRVLE